MSIEVSDKQKRADWLAARLIRMENKVTSLAEPYDELRDGMGFLKNAVMDYLKTLDGELILLQQRIRSLETTLDETRKENKELTRENEELKMIIHTAEPQQEKGSGE